MLCDPEFWITLIISIFLAVSVPLWVEHMRRPLLVVELGNRVSGTFRIVHIAVRNLPMAERGRVPKFFGRWLTAFAADGCALEIEIEPVPHPLRFMGKWTSRAEPLTDSEYDPQKLPGAHEVSLQPGTNGDQVAIAIRRPGSANAYAYNVPLVYLRPPTIPFPEHPDLSLRPGSYAVAVQASAGEIRSERATYTLTVSKLPDDSLTLV